MDRRDAILRILDLARWAPSGDNTQPWRFEIVDDFGVMLHGFDTRDRCVYDLDGHASQISIGALLETASIAASEHGWRMDAQRYVDAPETRPTFRLTFVPDAVIAADALLPFIDRRSVQRRPLSTRPLTAVQKAALEAAVGTKHCLIWLDGLGSRLQTALVLFRSAKIRLTMPEAYRVHRDIIEWNSQFSEDKVPSQALGVDALTLRLMQFVMVSWGRVSWFNRYMAGTWLPRIELDLIPGVACAAHFVLLSAKPPRTVDDFVAAGRSVQRLWLTATRLGLQLQPELTPLIFSRYAREGRAFSTTKGMDRRARIIGQQLDRLVGAENNVHGAFMGRIGSGRQSVARSTRLALTKLIK